VALDRAAIQSLYRRRAKRYDFTANLYYLLGFREQSFRKQAVAALGLEPGDTVVEIGCGTGLNFPLLQRAVGPEGRIVGVDFTDAMLSRARERVARRGWTNVHLVRADAATFPFPVGIDGIISTFALTLVSEYDAVIRRGAESLAPGGRWVVADLKLPATLVGKLTPLLLPVFRPFGVTLDLAQRHPWESLQRHLGNVELREAMFGFVYVASAGNSDGDPPSDRDRSASTSER